MMRKGDLGSPFLCRHVLRQADFKQVRALRALVTLARGSNRAASQQEPAMQLRHRLIALILIATATTAAQAASPSAPATPLADCVDLSPQHETFRFESQYLLVQDGD